MIMHERSHTDHITIINETLYMIQKELKEIEMAVFVNKPRPEHLSLADKLCFSIKNFFRLIESYNQPSNDNNGAQATKRSHQAFIDEIKQYLELYRQGRNHLSTQKLSSWEQQLVVFYQTHLELLRSRR
ncbi:MAG: hypothetical protein HN353_02375 [Bdellovibrionales bacterium]|nr:hypothetical protein [Bdellovibrionales bacterium]MBT3525532.1 hypothetical protein [Bdellovibrionales bacterium]